MGNRGILTICLAAFLVVIFTFKANAQLYATSDKLDRFNGSTWTNINLTADGVRNLQANQVGADSVGNIYVSDAIVGNTQLFASLMKFTPGDESAIFSLFIGRFAIDSNDFMYNTERYSPLGTCLNSISRIDTRSNLDNGDIIGYLADINDIVYDGSSIVVVGGFFKAYSGDLSQYTRATHVARYDGTWKPIGDGIPGVPTRVVADHNRNLVAFVPPSTMWRWDGSVWTSYQLNLAASSGTPSISDLDFGTDKLFIVGNFNSVNGVAAANVATLQWNGTALTVEQAFNGIPNIVAQTVLATSDNRLMWVGGSENNVKTVYLLRNQTWVNSGFISDPLDSGDTTITGLVFIPPTIM